MPKQDQVELRMNIPELIEFKFNDPKTGTGQYGEWYCYGVVNRGIDKVFFPTKYLNDKIRAFAPLQGKTLEIVKTEGEGNSVVWLVNIPGQTQETHDVPATKEDHTECHERFEKMVIAFKKMGDEIKSLRALVELVAGEDATTLHATVPPKAKIETVPWTERLATEHQGDNMSPSA